MKKALCLSLAVNLEKVIWNWMEKHHDEFACLVSKPNDQLSGVKNFCVLALKWDSVHYSARSEYVMCQEHLTAVLFEGA